MTTQYCYRVKILFSGLPLVELERIRYAVLHTITTSWRHVVAADSAASCCDTRTRLDARFSSCAIYVSHRTDIAGARATRPRLCLDYSYFYLSLAIVSSATALFSAASYLRSARRSTKVLPNWFAARNLIKSFYMQNIYRIHPDARFVGISRSPRTKIVNRCVHTPWESD